MSRLALLAIFVAPACSQLVLRLGPVQEDSRSNLENFALPGGIVVAKSLPMTRSAQPSPLEEMVQQFTSGVEDDEPSPEQMFQQLMMNGFEGKSLLRRSRKGFSQSSPELMLKQMMMNMGDDSLFSGPSMSSSSFSRTHTISDGDGRVEVKQTQCQDGFCMTRKSTSSSTPSMNPFVKIKSLRATQPQVDVPTLWLNGLLQESPEYKVFEPYDEPVAREPAVPETAVKQDAAQAARSNKKETLVQDLADLATALEKGITAATGKDEKRAPAGIADISKEEHVMEV